MVQDPLVRFDLNLLPALDALLTERHVTRASERLNVSQSTMSGILVRLRIQFADPLLVRTGRDMELTPKGAALKARVHGALVVARDLLTVAPSFEPATADRGFRVAMSDYCVEVFLPALTRLISNAAPAVQIWTENLGPDSYDRLASGDIDFCITTDDDRLMGRTRQSYGLLARPLFTDGFVCVVSADRHPGADRLSAAQFEEARHAVVRFIPTLMTIEGAAFRDAGLAQKARLVIPNFSSLIRMIPGTDMIATVHHRLVALHAASLPIRIVAAPIAIPLLHETLVWHPRSNDDPAQVWLRDRLAEVGDALQAATPPSLQGADPHAA